MELNQKDVLNVVPIRKPMLCVDQICKIEYGHSVQGYRNIEKDEYWSKCHFVNQPIFPGTLIIETMAQVSAFIFYNKEKPQSLKSYLGKVDKIKFVKSVVPECRMYINAEVIMKIGKMVKVNCKAFVDEEIVASGELILYFVNENLLDK